MVHGELRRTATSRCLRAACALWVFGATAWAQSPPEATAKKLRPAPGLSATLWASEPLVVNPTSMDVDSRGRVWVAEGLNYRLSRGANRQFHRVDDSDKIKILEDTDGDGRADKMTVFADRIFPVPMGLAVEERYGLDGKYLGCKVYVGNSPDLLVLEDTDGDDKADKRYALLTGFGGVDSDHGVHGMRLGLDGKLYFTHGDGCCSVQQDHSERAQNFDVIDKSGRHVTSDQLAHTLRCDRDGTNFEIIADRQRNNYETCLDSFGNIFTSDNDDDGNRGCRVIHAIDGAHYGYRTPGSPRHWGEDVPGMMPKMVGTGNGSPCGVAFYESDRLGKAYEGAVLEAEAGTRQINVFPLARHGATFRTDYKVLLGSDDPWFRPTDVAVVPDGSILISDWYDGGVGGHAFKDQTTGRIYRVAKTGQKAQKITYNFATVPGLIAALKSPVIATQDAARRGLIARSKAGSAGAAAAVQDLFMNGTTVEQARAFWTLQGIDVDQAATTVLTSPRTKFEPRLREQAVRILGRDDRENGKVEYRDPKSKPTAPALKHLNILLGSANDPDAGVRRELILALRTLPTEKVGEALRTLTQTWDGQDRWYLESLGLALDGRESIYIASLFDGNLFGDLDLERAGEASDVALPPYFPADRNEAYVATGTSDRPASPLSKTLGLAWRLHRAESLPLLRRILPKLESPEMKQAGDDVLRQMRDPKTVELVVDMASDARADAGERRALLDLLARKLDGDWRDARALPKLVEATSQGLADPLTARSAIALAVASGAPSLAGALRTLADSPKADVDLRVVAVEALGRVDGGHNRAYLEGLIASASKTRSAQVSILAEAAVRALPRVEDATSRLINLVGDGSMPLGVRREALRTLAARGDGARRVIALAKEGKLAADLKTEATTTLSTHPDRGVRDEAARVLPPPHTASGRPLPPIQELMRRRGDVARGRAVFFKKEQASLMNGGVVSCGSCHRVQGQGAWIGPDLSTIGTKYGKDELLRSILNPSAAIGYNFRAQVVATKDGRVLTGLLLEESPERIVLKTREGKRVSIATSEVEERATSDVSLMPEGLAQNMNDRELVDLLAFLESLRRPVGVVGQYQAAGPTAGESSPTFATPATALEPKIKLPGGATLAYRRVTSDAEGAVELTALGADPKTSMYLSTPISSPVEQEARLVLDTTCEVEAWLDGKPVAFEPAAADAPRAATVTLPKGASALLIRVRGGSRPSLSTTIVAAKPVGFEAAAATASH